MSAEERRWLDNLKKAFFKSDQAFKADTPEDVCLPELFKAIDTAKTLRRSLRGDPVDRRDNRSRFIDFLALEIPCAALNEKKIEWPDGKTSEMRSLTLGELIYEARCMVHENENLSATEPVSHYFVFDWTSRDAHILGRVENGRFFCNAFAVWSRLREVLAKFITFIDAIESFHERRSFSMTIRPQLGSIRHLRATEPSQ